jgi:hypothetical protein
VGPCQHSTARPQVAGGGTASNMDGSCEIDRISSRGRPKMYDPSACKQGEILTTAQCKTLPYYEPFYKISDVDWSFGTTQALGGGGGEEHYLQNRERERETETERSIPWN